MNKVRIEYLWAYDWRIVWYYKDNPKELYFRIWDLKIIDYCQSEDYGPVYFELEWNKFYRNLTEITEEEFYKNYTPKIKI